MCKDDADGFRFETDDGEEEEEECRLAHVDAAERGQTAWEHCITQAFYNYLRGYKYIILRRDGRDSHKRTVVNAWGVDHDENIMYINLDMVEQGN